MGLFTIFTLHYLPPLPWHGGFSIETQLFILAMPLGRDMRLCARLGEESPLVLAADCQRRNCLPTLPSSSQCLALLLSFLTSGGGEHELAGEGKTDNGAGIWGLRHWGEFRVASGMPPLGQRGGKAL